MKGRLMAAQVPAAAPAAWTQARIRPALRQSTSSGPRKNSGYSFAAAPTPSSTPASTGFRRDHASRAVAAAAVASVSKFVNACTTMSGDTAAMAASHTLRRAVRATAQTVTSQAADRKNAVRLK